MHLLSYLVSFLAGLCGAMGFGSGTVLLLYLTAVLQIDQQTAQGINLIFFLPCALVALLFYRKQNAVQIRQVLPLLLWTLPGAAIGFALLGVLPMAALRRIFGGFLLLLAGKELFALIHKKKQ